MANDEELLTLDDCQSIASGYLGDTNISIRDYQVKPLGNPLNGLIGEQYTVNIKYDHKGKISELQAFFKILNGKSKTMFHLSKEIKAFEKEDFFYNQVVPAFRKYHVDVSFVPKCYFCVPYTVVLEDLSLQKFICTDKQRPLDLEHCKRSMEVLAKLHAAGIIYEKKKSLDIGQPYKLLDDYSGLLKDVLFSEEENAASRWLRCSVQGLNQIIDLIPENTVTGSKFKSVLNEALDKIISKTYDNMTSSILHGDLWSNNFLYKYKCDEIEDVKLIDFQTVKYGPPALDVEQFLMTNTRKIFRDEYERCLVDHYYDTFAEIIETHGFYIDDVMTRVEFLSSCETMKIPAKIQAVVDRSVTYMSDEVFGEVIKDEELFTKFLFSDRGKYILESYNNNQGFKELMLEDMLELRDLLFRD